MRGTNLINRDYGLGRTFDDLFDLATNFDDRVKSLSNISGSRLNVVTDENENEYIVKAEVPGINEDNLDVSFDNGVLSITADYKDEGEGYLRQGKYSWACTVSDVDYENISADLKNGILHVTLPKSEKAKPRKISINK